MKKFIRFWLGITHYKHYLASYNKGNHFD